MSPCSSIRFLPCVVMLLGAACAPDEAAPHALDAGAVDDAAVDAQPPQITTTALIARFVSE